MFGIFPISSDFMSNRGPTLDPLEFERDRTEDLLNPECVFGLINPTMAKKFRLVKYVLLLYIYTYITLITWSHHRNYKVVNNHRVGFQMHGS